MKDHENVWIRIATHARRAPAGAFEEAPPGFVTRVVARGLEARRRPDELISRYAFRAFAAAAAFAVVFAATNINLLSAERLAEGYGEDPVGEFLTEL